LDRSVVSHDTSVFSKGIGSVFSRGLSALKN
jgi:hypothetical protein